MRRFSFLVSDVSISSVYLLLQMPFWQLRYLQGLDIRFRRCSFLDRCICNLLFLWLADAFQPAYHVQLHLHLSFSRIWGYFLFKFYICIPRFLWSADTSHQNFASSIPKNSLSQIPSPNTLCILFTSCTEPIHGLQKIDIRNSSEYEMSGSSYINFL